MSDLPNNSPDNTRDTDRMSLRNSLLVWVFGAVLGWVVAVVAIYTVIRTADEPLIVRDGNSQQMVPHLERIEPAAGGEEFRATPVTPKPDAAHETDDRE